MLPDGRILDLRSEIQKDNTGYDLKQLFISGEGTLGVITKLNILCEKADQNKRIMVLKADNYNTVLSSLPILRRVVGKHLNALEYLDGFTYRIVSKYVNVELFDKVSDTDHLLFVELTTDDIE